MYANAKKRTAQWSEHRAKDRNHDQTVVRPPRVRRGPATFDNHNQTMVRTPQARGGAWNNHNQSVVRRGFHLQHNQTIVRRR